MHLTYSGNVSRSSREELAIMLSSPQWLRRTDQDISLGNGQLGQPIICSVLGLADKLACGLLNLEARPRGHPVAPLK